MTQCPRCGKKNVDPIYPHTCTPLALRLACEYADAFATHRLQSLYGTSKKYTLVKATERDEAYEALAAELCRLHTALERETASRQAAPIEKESLKARIARSGVEQQRAVLAEREACARVCDERAMKNEHACEGLGDEDATSLRSAAWQMSVCAAAIRARGAAPQQEGETK